MKRTLNLHRNNFPYFLSEYRFSAILNEDKQLGIYSIARYLDKNNNPVIVKRWAGRHKDLRYLWLNNEIKTYELINKLHLDSKVKTPKLLKVIEGKNVLYMVIEFMKDKDLSDLKPKEKVDSFISVLLFLEKVGIHSDLDSSGIAHRRPLFWIAILPLISARAIINNPRNFISILRSIIYVVLSLPQLLSRSERGLVHRDLNDHNVFYNKGELFVIDFELASIADPLIDWAILFLKYSKDEKFTNYLKKMPRFQTLIKDNVARRVLCAYLIIFAIYDLGSKNDLHGLDLRFLNQLEKNIVSSDGSTDKTVKTERYLYVN